MANRVIVALSGGLDSGVLLAQAIEEGHEIYAITFDYGSKHNRWEIQAAQSLIQHYAGKPVRHEVFDIRPVFSLFRSSLLAHDHQPIPEGHYHEESMRKTVVPFRNGILLSILAGLAESHGIPKVRIAVHAGDHFIYPDCREKFLAPMGLAIRTGTDSKVSLDVPFLYADKFSIVKFGREIDFPFKLSRTCYTEHQIACGRCGSCQERLEAFHKNGFEDPLPYSHRELMQKQPT